MMFFWLCSESIRKTSIRLASLTWISTVPASETLTSELLTERPSPGWVAGAAATGLVVGASPVAAVGVDDVDGCDVAGAAVLANGSLLSSRIFTSVPESGAANMRGEVETAGAAASAFGAASGTVALAWTVGVARPSTAATIA